MLDDLVGLAAAASADVAIDKASKRHRWIRILMTIVGLLFVALVVGLIYITINYS